VKYLSHDGVGLEGDLNLIDADSSTDTESMVGSAHGPKLDTKDLLQIQKDIASTIRPMWRTSPPKNFGTPTHGKPKVDKWRACIEFDLPVSLVKLWLHKVEKSSVDESEKT
jgi:hypothetical protein